MASIEPADLSTIIRASRAQRNCYLGLNEVCRAIEQGGVKLCLLANDVNDDSYKKLIEALSGETRTALVKVDSKELLGEWAGLAKIDEEGNVTKQRPCGCIAIKTLPAGPSGEKVKAFLATQGTE